MGRKTSNRQRPTTTASGDVGPGRNVYVASMPLSITQVQVRKMVAEFGAITSISRIFNDTRRSAEVGRSYCFVLFDTERAAAACVAGLHDLQLGDRRLQVKLSRGPPGEGRPDKPTEEKIETPMPRLPLCAPCPEPAVAPNQPGAPAVLYFPVAPLRMDGASVPPPQHSHFDDRHHLFHHHHHHHRTLAQDPSQLHVDPAPPQQQPVLPAMRPLYLPQGHTVAAGGWVVATPVDASHGLIHVHQHGPAAVGHHHWAPNVHLHQLAQPSSMDPGSHYHHLQPVGAHQHHAQHPQTANTSSTTSHLPPGAALVFASVPAPAGVVGVAQGPMQP